MGIDAIQIIVDSHGEADQIIAHVTFPAPIPLNI